MSVSDKVIKPVAHRLLACLDEQRLKIDADVRPALIGLRPGNVMDLLLSMNDSECCKGIAWVRVDGVFPSADNFPNPDLLPMQRCGIRQWAIRFEIGIARCAPTPGARKMTTTDVWNTAADQIYDDFAALDKTICCFADGYRWAWVAGQWTPLPTGGACMGGSITLTVAAPACNCGPDDSPS
jgi:hypothetical protein